MDFSDFMESDRAAKKRDPKEYARGVAADEKQAAKAYAQTAEGLAERETPKREKVGNKFVTSYTPLAGENHITGKVPGEPGYKPMTAEQAKQFDAKGNKISGGGGGGGGGIPKVGAKRTPEFKKGGKVNASSRADGIAQRGRTKGRMV